MSTTVETNQLRTGAVILAAGASTRMDKPKMLLPWGATSVIGHLIAQWRRLKVEQLAVVCGSVDLQLQTELDRLDFPAANRILNPAPERGMFSSIRCAARWTGWGAGLTHWAIALGDQPHLRPATLSGLLEFGAAHPEAICQPSYLEHARHPVLIPKSPFKELAESPHETLKDFLKIERFEVMCFEVDDPGLDLDIDQPADYERALQLYLKSA
ncbi:MAG: nucleotidyltransferase family protein [Candidatus Omnitrophica bacterium]|nr:nucleotidyltransferase family protein [Candidatus Omnitrophota bacterium]